MARNHVLASLCIALLVALGALVACDPVVGVVGDNGVPGGDPCLMFDASGVTFTLLKDEVFQPSVVRLSFRLATCDGQPLPGIPAGDFVIKENGVPVSPFESDQGFALDEQCFTLATVLLLDMSGSILGSGNLPVLQTAAKAFVPTVAEQQLIAIYTFDGREDMQLLTDFTRDVATLSAGIDSLTNYVVVDRSTNLNGAVVDGLEVLNEQLNSLAPGVLSAGSLVVFTDGTDQAARVPDSKAVSDAEESEHAVYTIGLGGEVDTDHLDAVGTDGTFIANDVDALEGVFQEVADAIQATAQSNYVLAYCSPKRANTNTLELSLTEHEGSVTVMFDAETFEGGCSAEDFLGDSGCDPESECEEDEDCDDGDVCNGQEACVSSRCLEGTTLACDDGNPCTIDTCDSQAGCVSVAAGDCCESDLDCDDQEPCTTDECTDGACGSTAIPGCGEGFLLLNLGDGETMELIRIPAGTFMMGSENGDSNEEPVHSVTISQEFWLGKYEVTQAQYEAVMGTNPSNLDACGDDCPIDTVSWEDAVDFAEALSGASGYDIRLPTEAEWEYACRAGTTTEYYFGDDDSQLGDYAWYSGNQSGGPEPVGQKFPNDWGLFDMHGNMREWCSDWNDSSYYGVSPSIDPAGPSSGTFRILRGGSWAQSAYICRSANRTSATPSGRAPNIGFRVASGT